MDRQSISDAETGGHSKPANYWIPPNILLAPPHAAPMEDLDRANALMAEAGYEDGIEVEWLSPIPNYFSLGERVISQLRRIGITAKLQTMERGTYFDRLEEGATIQDRTSAWGDGNQILLIGTGTAGAFVARFKAYVGCEAFASRMCVPEIDEVIAQYDASVNPAEREQLAAKANAAVADGYYKIPIYWFSFIDAVEPRIAVMSPGSGVAYPYRLPQEVERFSRRIARRRQSGDSHGRRYSRGGALAVSISFPAMPGPASG